MRVCHSPELIAAYHGLHRLCVPRHPPHTLVRLTLSQSVKQSTRYIERVMRRYRAPSLAAKRIGVTTLSLVFVSVNRHTRPESRPRRSTSRSLPPSVVNQPTIKIEIRDVQSGRQIRDFRTDPPKRPPYSSLRKGGDPAAGSPTATLLRLRPSHCARLRRLGPLRVPAPTSGAHSFHGVTGGVYKARERIHRGVADPRLLAIPASCRRVAADNPN
jgi:hypothetical protein